MSDSRAAILARLRSAQRTAKLPAENGTLDRPEPAASSREECLWRFRNELDALGVENHLEPTPEAVRARVSALVAGRRVLAWDPELLPYEVGSLLAGTILGSSPRDEQASAELGLTGCDAAIAETGTVALLSGKGKSRAVSLLPPVHVAIVRPADLCASTGEFFRAQALRLAEATSCTFVTGPSRTADIELTLTLGVHGPGRVVVVIGP